MTGPTDPAEEYFDKGSWGWDLSAWHKLPMLWGFSARWHETVVGVAAGAIEDLFTTAVPAGYCYVLNAADCYNVSSACDRNIAAYDSGAVAILISESAVLAAVHTVTGYQYIVLEEGDQVRARFTACNVGDTLALRVWGFTMAVGQ